MRQADRRRRLRATVMTNRHVRMAPSTPQITLSPPPLVLFVLLELRLEIRARAVITHAGGASGASREWQFELRRERRHACALRDRRRAYAARARYGWRKAQERRATWARCGAERHHGPHIDAHTRHTPRRSLLHAGAVAVEAATDDARDHARLPTRTEITRECGGVHVTSAQRSADPASV